MSRHRCGAGSGKRPNAWRHRWTATRADPRTHLTWQACEGRFPGAGRSGGACPSWRQEASRVTAAQEPLLSVSGVSLSETSAGRFVSCRLTSAVRAFQTEVQCTGQLVGSPDFTPQGNLTGMASCAYATQGTL